jgi:class 3 adenylate cyclase
MPNLEIIFEERVILFMDIHNYSIAAGTLGDQAPHFLQVVFETLGEIIVSAGGEIIKYMGDAILSVFPAGTEKQAVGAALELRATFAQVAGRWDLPPEIELEIGISTGRVGLGLFGHRSLRQKDVFGEAVNCAAAIGHHRGIAVTESIHQRVDTHYRTRRLPDRAVKWRTEPLRIWEIVSLI